MTKSKEEKQFYYRFLVLIIIVFIVVAGKNLFTVLPADQAAESAAISDDLVEISNQPKLIALVPRDVILQRGIIFYPGARVDPVAYIPMLRSLAEEGIVVIIPKMPLNYAIFGINRTAEIQDAYPQVTCWIIAGHSLGGSMAAEYAKENSYRLDGIVFVASYPGKNTSLHGMDIQGLVIRGTNDGLVSEEEIDQVLENFPTDTKIVVLQGANHAQFGHYGVQRGDGQATMSAEEQDAATSLAILEFVGELNGTCVESPSE
ncbi:MAG: hypothetical protein JEZ00_08095 [Anaerolineaceae bacterium]|nr:hypothetical protein [Anaerolineaceae bacterium]